MFIMLSAFNFFIKEIDQVIEKYIRKPNDLAKAQEHIILGK